VIVPKKEELLCHAPTMTIYIQFEEFKRRSWAQILSLILLGEGLISHKPTLKAAAWDSENAPQRTLRYSGWAAERPMTVTRFS
jgi:hypothetical protein